MGVVLALTSAACYGLSDFLGGILARRSSFLSVALLGQLGGLALTLVAAPLATGQAPAAGDLGWGALSGVGTGIGMTFLFRGLGRGTMAVVVPVSAVGGIALPVLVGVAVLGDRPAPLTWLGMVAAVPALWLVSGARRGSATPRAALDGMIAGAGIALQYMALAQAGSASGLWPVAAGRVTAAGGIMVLIAATRAGRPVLPLPRTLAAAATGALAAIALTCYLLATRLQLVTVAVVLSSLYPVIPVLLGISVLRERLSRRQAVGLIAAGLAVVLITLG